MPDNIPLTVATEVSTPVTPTPTPEVTPVVATPALSPREAIAQKYEKIYGGSPTPTPSDPVVAPALGDPPVPETPVEEVTPPVTIDPPTPDRLSSVEATLAKVTEALAGITQALQPKPIDPIAPVVSEDNEFWALARAGKLDEAKKSLMKEIADQLTGPITQEAQDRFTIETEANRFINDLRGKNPDLMPLEELITARAAQKIEEASKAGKIKTSKDYLEIYKSSVTSAADDARKIVQSIRAAGKTEGQVRTREVLSSTPLTPTPIEQNRQAPAVDVPESTTDYLKRREIANYKMRGISVQPNAAR